VPVNVAGLSDDPRTDVEAGTENVSAVGDGTDVRTGFIEVGCGAPAGGEGMVKVADVAKRGAAEEEQPEKAKTISVVRVIIVLDIISRQRRHAKSDARKEASVRRASV
jgi:hypothetical protein